MRCSPQAQQSRKAIPNRRPPLILTYPTAAIRCGPCGCQLHLESPSRILDVAKRTGGGL